MLKRQSERSRFLGSPHHTFALRVLRNVVQCSYTDHKCMVTAVSGLIEQVVVWLRNSKTQLPSINPLKIPLSFKKLAQTGASNRETKWNRSHTHKITTAQAHHSTHIFSCAVWLPPSLDSVREVWLILFSVYSLLSRLSILLLTVLEMLPLSCMLTSSVASFQYWALFIHWTFSYLWVEYLGKYGVCTCSLVVLVAS